MLRRCGQLRGAKPEDLARYAARGVRVCPEWRNFAAFAEWAQANGYAEGLQIDRIDNDGPYSPENCRWVTHKENNQNRGDQRLAAEDVRQIKALIDAGATNKKLAGIYGVSQSMVSMIRHGRCWANVSAA